MGHSSESSLSSLDVTLFLEHRGNNEAKFVLHHCLKYFVTIRLLFRPVATIYNTYIKVGHDELEEFVREVFLLSLPDLVGLQELFSISDNTDRNTVELDSNDMLIFPHHLSH